MSWRGKLNYYFLQWFFIRFYADVHFVPDKIEPNIVGHGLMIGVVPGTGWNTDYKFFPFKEPKYIKFWRKNDNQIQTSARR